MPSALLFGASGQIGQALCARLLAAGWQVSAVSRRVQPAAADVQWLQGDLGHGGEWSLRADAIFSCGPQDLFSLWYAGSSISCPRVVAFGSTSATVKQDSPDPAERRLAQLLRDSEARILATAAARGAHATLLRPTLIYGAGRDRTLTRIAQLARRTGFFILPRDANGLRQPVHVNDLADAALAVLDSEATKGVGYALPGGETLTYAQMVERTLASLRPPARLIQVPAPLFKMALSGAKLFGGMRGLNDAAVARMREDLVFDAEPARRDFGYAPRRFAPGISMFTDN